MMQGAEEDSIASREAKTLLLFGRVGNGKSAVGNSIIGKKVFVSRVSASGVTTECQMETATLDDGEVVNVIDTPGIYFQNRFEHRSQIFSEMFKSSKGADQRLVDETLRSINTLAKDGIHGFIMVCSIRTRFSAEEDRIVQSLKLIFGEKILDHMIIVFTGGDDLEDMTFPEYLSTLPPSFQTILNLCGNRVVLFDNKSKEESQQRRVQVQQLMLYIIRAENGQVPKLNIEEAGKNGQTTASKVGHIVGHAGAHIGLHMGVDAALGAAAPYAVAAVAAAPAAVAAAPYAVAAVAAGATCTIM